MTGLSGVLGGRGESPSISKSCSRYSPRRAFQSSSDVMSARHPSARRRVSDRKKGIDHAVTGRGVGGGAGVGGQNGGHRGQEDEQKTGGRCMGGCPDRWAGCRHSTKNTTLMQAAAACESRDGSVIVLTTRHKPGGASCRGRGPQMSRLDQIDEFESLFRRSEREPFVFADIPIESVARWSPVMSPGRLCRIR
ncbi:MAG: hypothetical protein CM1200mP2_31780 [Planctomycetaceae bacterium]|nr:MAG: hypothetical protein CM1200mP2_31780 [Planctomycetaceae bacterium]